MTMASNVTGKINEKYSKINLFFDAKKNVDSLLVRNAELLNQQTPNLAIIDTSVHEVADYIVLDTLGNTKKIVQYIYRPATVIYNNTTNDDLKNYMLLNRGTANGIAKDMAVLGAESNAVIGKIIYADAQYAVVMTLLHTQSILSAKLKNTGENGSITWDGGNSRTVILKKIPSSVTLKVGDSIVTNNGTDIYPENL